MIWIYDSRSGEKRKFQPLEPNSQVSMYVCGPTVYDEPHIGHLRSAYIFDTIRKTLALSYPVRFVRNVTDVDDKIIERAAKEKQSVSEVASKYFEIYQKAVRKLGVADPDAEPKATDHIEDMKRLIGALLEKEVAYAAAGNIYFRVRRFDGYGALSHQRIDEMLENVRTEPGEGKEDPLDFALWKKSAPGEPVWDALWGPGRPGWHIECSAMSTRYLGEEFDIHGGGRDLIFPHHENERAQSMAACGKGFARVWIHHGLLTLDGRKMSKSLGNFLTLDAVLEKHSLDALKLLFVQSHYRSDVDFTWVKMRAFEEVLRRFYIFFQKTASLRAAGRGEPGLGTMFREAMEDDFDTPRALSVLFEALNRGNQFLIKGKAEVAAGFSYFILEKGQTLGLFNDWSRPRGMEKWSEMFQQLVELRNECRKSKWYDLSDSIRVELTELGFLVEDSKDSSRAVDLPSGITESEMSQKLYDLLVNAIAKKTARKMQK